MFMVSAIIEALYNYMVLLLKDSKQNAVGHKLKKIQEQLFF